MSTFPSINEQNGPKRLFEQHINEPVAFPTRYNNQNFNGSYMDGPDWTPDFSQHINIEAESIQLALHTLGISKAEYNSMSIQDLNQKKIHTTDNSNCALNILIYYKQNSKSFLPQFNPIKHMDIPY